MSIKILLTVFVLSLFNKVNAGTHICYVYKGVIGSDPVVFNIQIEESYSKANLLKVNGVYIYQKENSPIPLAGILDLARRKLVLQEIIGGKNRAILNLTFSEKLMTGIRKKTNSTLSQIINLQETSSLIDTAAFDNTKVTGVEIIQDTSLKNYLLVGVYSKMDRYYDAEMDQLKLIDKKTGKPFQIIDLTSIEDPSGVQIENIFKNVEISDHNKDGYNDVAIWNKSGKYGSRLYAYYNQTLKKYQLDPNPEEMPHIERHWPDK